MAYDLTQLRQLRSEEELRAIIGFPLPVVCTKIVARLNHTTRPFVERSPFVLLATAAADGTCDVSPRGDPPGFVRILDDTTLLIPDRPGNRLADALRNIVSNPNVGLLFVIPGVTETFRVNGRAFITDDRELLAGSTVEERIPKLGVVVQIAEAFTQCSKAFLRSDVWNPDTFQERSSFASAGEIMRAANGEDFDASTYDTERDARYARREGFY
jgi:uncharacterized protein